MEHLSLEKHQVQGPFLPFPAPFNSLKQSVELLEHIVKATAWFYSEYWEERTTLTLRSLIDLH